MRNQKMRIGEMLKIRPFATARLALAVLFLLVSLTVVPVFAQEPQQKTTPTPQSGGTLVWGIISEPPNLLDCNPTFAFTMVSQQIYNNLVEADPQTGQWRPSLAQSWQVSPDGLTYTFNLVHNATWQDGVPFTSADVKFTFLKVLPLCNSFAAILNKSLSSIDTPDNYTVVFHFKHPYAPFTSPIVGISGTGWGIVPAHLYNNTNVLTNPYNNHPIGTGPWMFNQWVKGSYIEFVRNPHYWKGHGLPYLDKLIFQVYPSSSSLALAFQSGAVDFIWGLNGLSYADAARLISLQQSGNLPGKVLWVWPGVSASIDYIMFNLGPNGAAPLKNLQVRRALAMAVNNSEINQLAYSGLAQPLETPVPNSPLTSWYFNPNATEPSYNPTEANALLDQAGYPKGPNGIRFTLNLVISTSYPTYPQEADIIKTDLSQVGVQVNIEAEDLQTFETQVFVNNNYDMFIFPMSTGPDPVLLYNYFTGYGITHTPFSNAGYFNNSQVNQLLSESQTDLNRTSRGQLVKEAEQIIVNNQPGIWTIFRTYVNALNLDFSDQYQPLAWEYAGGGYMFPMEGVEYVGSSSTTTTSVTPPATSTSTSTATTQTTTTSASSNYTPLVVGLVVAAIIIIIIAVALTRRRPGGAAPS